MLRVGRTSAVAEEQELVAMPDGLQAGGNESREGLTHVFCGAADDLGVVGKLPGQILCDVVV